VFALYLNFSSQRHAAFSYPIPATHHWLSSRAPANFFQTNQNSFAIAIAFVRNDDLSGHSNFLVDAGTISFFQRLRCVLWPRRQSLGNEPAQAAHLLVRTP
jgi:hypothetical protein